jgi:hypothetical protein
VILQKGHLSTEMPSEAGRVGSKHKGFPFVSDRLQGIDHLTSHFGIKSRGGFIQNENFRIVTHSSGEGDPLALPARQFGRTVVGMGEKLEALKKRVSTGYRIATRKSVGTNQRQGDVFLGIEMREEIAVLKDETETASMDAEVGFIWG